MMKNFFDDLKNSIYGPGYYQSLQQSSFGKSLKYFVFVAVLSALVNAIYYGFVLIPPMKTWVGQVESGILQNYPHDLELTIKKGIVSINQPEPYIIKSFPLDSKDIQTKGVNLKMDNTLVIDTKNSFSLEQFKNYKTICWLGASNLACLDNNGTVKINDLTKAPDFTLNQSVVENFLNKINPWINFLYPIFAVMLLLGSLFISVSGNLFYLIFGALIVWFIASLKRITLGYNKAYLLGLHLVTLPMIFELIWQILLNSFNVKINTIPFLFTIIFIIVTVLNLKKEENNAPVVTSSLT